MSEMSGEQDAWWQAVAAGLDAMKSWINRSVRFNRHMTWVGVQDEATFISSWFAHYLATGDSAARDFMGWMFEQYLAYSATHFYHGYFPEQEAHHGPELALFFLPRFVRAFPEDDRAVLALEDAAHHVGNWAEGAPDWYDWERHRFRSYYLGTRVVRPEPPHDRNVPDHVRFAQVALSAYLATDKQRYLDVCCDYADEWCRAILADEERTPGALVPGVPADETTRAERDRDTRPDEARVELHVSAGTIDLMLDLFKVVGEQRYKDCAALLLQRVLPFVADPLSEPPAVLLAKWRRFTGDTRFDQEALKRLTEHEDEDAAAWVMFFDTTKRSHPMGIGRRMDEVRWGYRRADGALREQRGPSPSGLMLAHQIKAGAGASGDGDERFLLRSLRMAATRVRMAAKCLVDGRRHGCAGGSVSAVASGHGRNAGMGCMLGSLYPAVLGSCRFASADQPLVGYKKEDGTPGLPDGVCALCEPCDPDRERIVRLMNTADDPTCLRITVADTDGRIARCEVDGQAVSRPGEKDVEVPLALRKERRLNITLA